MIYFIKNNRTGSYKIGVSDRPEQRLKELQTANEDRLVLEWTIKNSSYDEEREFHNRWRHLKIRGEWFKDETGEIADFLASAHDLRVIREAGGVNAMYTHTWFAEFAKLNKNGELWWKLWSRSLVGHPLRRNQDL